MANFDALRSAIIGPLEYICRPKEKPDALLACFPFNGDLLDVSKYNRPLQVSSSSFSDGGPIGKYVTLKGSFVHNTTIPFSLDFFAIFGGNAAGGAIVPSAQVGNTNGIWGGLCTITGSNLDFGTGGGNWAHIAITYDGETLKGFTNGGLKFTKQFQLNPQASISIPFAIRCANLRVVGKVVGNGSSYPVPTDFYTGYEAL